MQELLLRRCPRCGSEWEPTIAMNGGLSEFWVQCSNRECNAFYNTYKPQEHQSAFHVDNHRLVGNFGGYGSGKTTTTREELYKHIFLTPNGNALIGANVSSQYEQTLKREIEEDFPFTFVRYVSTQKSYVDMINGYRVMYRPFDDAGKLRSYNIDFFVILEASEVKEAAFTQLKTRLRNLAATVPETDEEGDIKYRAHNGVQIPVIKSNWMKGIIESNPSTGWIRDDVLLSSCAIYPHGTIKDNYEVDKRKADDMMSTHVTSTDANAYLPEDFIEQNSKNKAVWWVNRYLYGSFLYAEGLVYPSYRAAFVEPFEIPRNWKRIIAYDYGLADDSVFLFGAIDEKRHKLVVYKEARTNNKSVIELSKYFKKHCEDIEFGTMILPPIIDSRSGPKRDYNKKTLSEQFAEQGIHFMNSQIDKNARVFRTNTYIESLTLEIFETCVDLKRELDGYKFKSDENSNTGFTGKPVDKDDHGICALEFMIMELPADPANLVFGVYDRMGRDISKPPPPDEILYSQHVFNDIEDKETVLWSAY